MSFKTACANLSTGDRAAAPSAATRPRRANPDARVCSAGITTTMDLALPA